MLNQPLGQKQFLDFFDGAIAELRISDLRVQLARTALSTLFEKHYWKNARLAGTATAFFADHGIDHGVELARVVTQLFTVNASKIPPKSPLRRLETVLLIFSSLLFHDIGMSLPDAVRAHGLEEINREQLARPGHDARSLRYVETVLQGSQIPEWSAFWNTLQYQHWPTPCPYYAWLLVARICQTHGDPLSIWLTDDAIRTYTYISDPTKIINFSDAWSEQSWAEWAQVALACAAILNIADLCHLGPNRFPKLPVEWNALLPVGNDKKRNTFLHWASHQMLEVKFKEDRIEATLAMPQVGAASWCLVYWHGPGADLLRWGNHQRLNAKLRTFLSPDFDTIKIAQGPRREDVWKEVAADALSATFEACWEFADINNALTDNIAFSQLDKQVIIPSWWEGIARGWKDEIPFAPRGDIKELHFLADLRSKGLLIEELVSTDSFDITRKVFFVSERYDNHKSANHDALLNSFLGALRVARDLSIKTPQTIWRVVTAIKGVKHYEKLLGGFLEEYNNTIILCPYIRTMETQEVKLIVQAVLESPSEIRLILFGCYNDIERVIDTDGARVTIDDASKKLGYILWPGNQARYTDEGKLLVTINFNTLGGASAISDRKAASVLRTLLLRGSGAIELQENILSSLQKERWGENRTGLSCVLYLSLIDMMNYNGTGIKLSELHTMYNAVALPIGAAMIEEFKSIHDLVMTSQLVTAKLDWLAIKNQNELTDIRGVAAQTSAKATLVQIIALYKLQMTGSLINLGAVQLSNEPIGERTLERIIDYTMDESKIRSERTYVGMYMAKHISDHIQAGTINIVNVARLFVARDRDVRSFEGVLLFQIVYRSFSGCIDTSCKELYPVLREGKAALCGYVEAIASSEKSDRNTNRKYREITKQVITNLRSTLDSDPTGGDLNTIMLFDILTNYAARRRYLNNLMAELREDKFITFNLMADHFHGQSSRLKPSMQTSSLFKRWRSMRTALIEIVRDLTPIEMRRNRVLGTVAERAGI